MKSKKLIIFSILSILTICFFAGCTSSLGRSSAKINRDDYTKIMEKNKYGTDTQVVCSSYTTEDSDNDSHVLSTYTQYSSEEMAKEIFESIKEENSKSGNVEDKSTDDYSMYTHKEISSYTIYILDGNVIIQIDSDTKDYKKADELIEELGY